MLKSMLRHFGEFEQCQNISVSSLQLLQFTVFVLAKIWYTVYSIQFPLSVFGYGYRNTVSFQAFIRVEWYRWQMAVSL